MDYAENEHPSASGMCWVIIAQILASPDLGNVVLHFLRHCQQRVTADLTSGEKQGNEKGFPETEWLGCPSRQPLWVWILLGCPQLAGGTGICFSREKKSGVFPHCWLFIRHDIEGIRMWNRLSETKSQNLFTTWRSLLRLNEKGFTHSFIHFFAPSICIHFLVTKSALGTPAPLLRTPCYEDTETRLMATGASC